MAEEEFQPVGKRQRPAPVTASTRQVQASKAVNHIAKNRLDAGGWKMVTKKSRKTSLPMDQAIENSNMYNPLREVEIEEPTELLPKTNHRSFTTTKDIDTRNLLMQYNTR